MYPCETLECVTDFLQAGRHLRVHVLDGILPQALVLQIASKGRIGWCCHFHALGAIAQECDGHLLPHVVVDALAVDQQVQGNHEVGPLLLALALAPERQVGGSGKVQVTKVRQKGLQEKAGGRGGGAGF